MKMVAVSVALVASACIAAAIPTTAEVYFSPNGGCQDAVLSQLRSARRSVDVAIYSFTANRVALVLDSAVERGVKVRVVMDRQQVASNNSVAALLAEKLPLRIGAGGGLMHDKFAIVDDSVCVTGSYNWSDAAELKNDENLLVLASPALAKAYKDRFEIIWTYSVPESSLLAPPEGEQAPPSQIRPSQSGASSSGQGKAKTDGGDIVYITKSGKKYHREGCSSLSKSCIPISRKDAEARGYTPCSRCNP
jgi:phosphatidylserine/phosphatidylglycerophosphate/cardiolipin synthase-like enzyme